MYVNVDGSCGKSGSSFKDGERLTNICMAKCVSIKCEANILAFEKAKNYLNTMG